MSQEIVNITYVNSIDQPVLVKFTEQGLSGFSGASGTGGVVGLSGYSGVSGYSSPSGYSGYSGVSGYSGISAWSGTSGFSAYSGVSGYSGISAWSGVSGYSAWSGVSGFSGESAWSGFSGVSGWSAWSGVSGFSGESGWSGKPYQPLNATYTVLVGGIAADTNITIPDGLTYFLKSGTNQHLVIWQDGIKVRNESSLGAHDADYYEVSTTQVAFSYDLPEDTVLDFVILE